MWSEFKKFAIKGNVVDLAVGVIIGAAFGKIISSLVDDILMPMLGVVLGGVDLTTLSVTFYEAEIKYGSFIQSIVDFLIIAFSIFLFVRMFNRLRRKEEKLATPPMPDKKEELLMEIRDLLKNK